MLYSRLPEAAFDVVPNRLGRARYRERRQTRLRILWWLWLYRPQPFGESLRDLLCVARRPDARAVDAAASAIEKHAVGHDVEILLPLVHHVVAEQNLAEARPVHLNARIAAITLHRRGAAKNHGAIRQAHDFGCPNRRGLDKWQWLPWAHRLA